MTNEDLRLAMTRVRDAKATRRAELTAPAAAAAPGSDREPAGFAIGDRVFDTRGGREGTVSDVRPSSGAGEPAIYVRFDDGSSGTRARADLFPRPTRPAGRS